MRLSWGPGGYWVLRPPGQNGAALGRQAPPWERKRGGGGRRLQPTPRARWCSVLEVSWRELRLQPPYLMTRSRQGARPAPGLQP